MKNVDFAVEGLLAGEKADVFARITNERETTYALALWGKRFIFGYRKTRKDGPQDHNASSDGLPGP